MSPVDISMTEVAAASALVVVAAIVSRWRHADLEKDLGIAVFRSFVQLTAVGYVIQAIFDSDSLWLVAALLAGMVTFGAWTARGRAKAIPGVFWPLLLSLGMAAAATLGLVLALGVFEPKARYLVPVGGMVIGNAMTAAAVALNRLVDEVRGSAHLIEATLALGATSRQAASGLVSRSLRSGLIPLVDQTKTTGMVFFPGAMVGALLGGAEPVDAVRLQLILLWVLMGAAALSAVIATGLAYRRFFTPAHQLRDPPEPG
jgi:putative ABC transport system permease protein